MAYTFRRVLYLPIGAPTWDHNFPVIPRNRRLCWCQKSKSKGNGALAVLRIDSLMQMSVDSVL